MSLQPPLARIDISSSRSQLLDDHLLSTARRAAAFSRHSLAELAGRWHDLGKYHPDWQLDLHANKHGSDHSTAGAAHADKHVPGAWGQALALIIAGHHGGLSDMPKLTQRLREKAPVAAEAIAEAPAAILANNVPLPTRQPNDFDVRMLYSALVDADRLDAEAFEMRRERTSRHVPMAQLQHRLDAYIAKKEAISSPLSSIRQEIRIACETAAASASGPATPDNGGAHMRAVGPYDITRSNTLPAQCPATAEDRALLAQAADTIRVHFSNDPETKTPPWDATATAPPPVPLSTAQSAD